MISEATMRRLAFVRYLCEIAVAQSRTTEPQAAASLLTFHDSVELFLQLATEHLNVGVQRPEFMEYFGLLDAKLSPTALAQRESIRRMNKARVALKHNGTFPSRLDIESFRGTCTDFFETNTPLVFHIAFDDISLANLVSNDDVRAALKTADDHIASADLPAAQEFIALAFERLLLASHLGSRMHVSLPFHLPFELRELRELQRFLGDQQKQLEELRSEVGLLRHGIDTRQLRVFRGLTPNVAVSMAGNHQTAWFGPRPQFTTDQIRFCYGFVVDAALRIQEMDTYRSLTLRSPTPAAVEV
jgi:hypothetical protein